MVGRRVWTPVGQNILRFKIVDAGLATFAARNFTRGGGNYSVLPGIFPNCFSSPPSQHTFYKFNFFCLFVCFLRSGVRTLIFPADNEQDWDELPDYVRENLNVHFVEHYDEIYNILFK